jgi:hypothetical protein
MLKLTVLENKALVSFVLLLAITLMSNQAAFSQYVCQPQTTETINSTIDTSDPDQTTRLFRSGIASSCTGRGASGTPTAGTFNYESFTRTNTTGQNACVTVEITTACASTNAVFVAAYSSYDPASPNNNVIGTSGASTIANGTPISFGFPLAAGANYTIVVNEVTANAGCPAYSLKVTVRTGCRQAGFDRTNDGKADIALWRPSNGLWNTIDSAGGTNTVQFGQVGDITTPGDYTGDGRTDVSVYRPSNNLWIYGLNQTTPSTNFRATPYGAANDVPMPGDYDRDGKTDIAIWRPSDGFWYVLRSSDGTLLSRQWGQSGDIPVTGDYDGDLINDFGVVRKIDDTLHWFILQSNFNYTRTYPNTLSLTGFARFGAPTDKIVPGDYDGDGITDVAVFRPSDGTWYYRTSNLFNSVAFQFGQNGDIPQPADYDGDRKTDFAVWRPGAPQPIWLIYNSGSNTATGVTWGLPNDQPASSPYKVQ